MRHPKAARLLPAVAAFHAADALVRTAADADATDETMDRLLRRWNRQLEAVIGARARNLPEAQAKAACLVPALRGLLGRFEEDVMTAAELRLALSVVGDLVEIDAR